MAIDCRFRALNGRVLPPLIFFAGHAFIETEFSSLDPVVRATIAATRTTEHMDGFFRESWSHRRSLSARASLYA